ncbi:MAG TPA: nuclear transport factor 2 family protein [Pyrinomonadaceae bacterium]|jgi:ketosteroid isomerase-like protein
MSREEKETRATRGVESVEGEILEIEREVMSAIERQDEAALGRLVAEDFVFRDAAGASLAKRDFLRLATSLPVKILSVWGEQLEVRVYGETAVLTGRQRALVENADGQQEDGGTQIFTDVFVRREGRWLLALAHTVELPQTDAATEAPAPSGEAARPSPLVGTP